MVKIFSRNSVHDVAPTLLVVSNCQTLPVAAGLRKVFIGRSVKSISYLGGEDKVLQEIMSIRGLFTLITSADESITNAITDRFHPQLSQVVRIPEIYFPAFHPDQTYLQLADKRIIKSPIGDYHSRISIYCFLQGFSEEDCLMHFSEDTFQKIGYFDLWSSSILELQRRIEISDLGSECCSKFLSGHEVFMNSFNHPNLDVVRELVSCITKKLELVPSETLQEIDYDDHDYLYGPGLIFPVFPEVAQIFGEDGDYSFYAEDKNIYNLKEFIDHSYKIYAKRRTDLPGIDELFSSKFLSGMRGK